LVERENPSREKCIRLRNFICATTSVNGSSPLLKGSPICPPLKMGYFGSNLKELFTCGIEGKDFQEI